MTDELEINIDEDKEEKDWIRLLPSKTESPQTVEEALAALIKTESK